MVSYFKVGDLVAVLDDVLNGKVTAVNGKQITVKTTEGFLLDFEAADLVRVVNEQNDYANYMNVEHKSTLEKEEPKKKTTQKKSSKSKRQPVMEVDLHIHQLTASTKGMSNYDMLSLQIETAKRRLEFAIKKKIQRVVFIHGVGEGVLKKELEFLLAKYNVDVYPASFKKYGFGATKVYVYQNKN